MSKPPSEKPPKKPADETIATSVSKPNRLRTELFPFGLSAEQFAKLTREMLAIARLVCRHSGASPGDAVQQAFVKALSKPTADQPSTHDEKKFVAYMCTLAKYEALTNRTYQRRRSRREVAFAVDMAEMVVVPASVGAVEARKMLRSAFLALEPEDQELLHALYAEGKTIEDIAQERDQPWTTVDSQRKRILDLLYAAIQATIAALVLLVPKKARAFVANITQQVPHMLVPAAHFSSAMTVTAVCGVLLPTGSSAMAEPVKPVGLTPYSISQTAMVQGAGLPSSFLSEVEQEEPKVLDSETNQCSAGDMTSTKFTSFLQNTAVPLALVVAPALTQVACSGTEQQTPPAKQPEVERDDSSDPYESACMFARARGEECITREQFHRIGRPR